MINFNGFHQNYVNPISGEMLIHSLIGLDYSGDVRQMFIYNSDSTIVSVWRLMSGCAEQ